MSVSYNQDPDSLYLLKPAFRSPNLRAACDQVCEYMSFVLLASEETGTFTKVLSDNNNYLKLRSLFWEVCLQILIGSLCRKHAIHMAPIKSIIC